MKLNLICGLYLRPLLAFLLRHKSEYTSEAHRRHCVTRSADRSLVRTMPGWKVIGPPTGAITVGWQDVGTAPLMKAPIGTILTTITSAKDGNCMKATGITMITIATTETTATIRIATTITNGDCYRAV